MYTHIHALGAYTLFVNLRPAGDQASSVTKKPTASVTSVTLADALRGAPLVVVLPELPTTPRMLGQSGEFKTWP